MSATNDKIVINGVGRAYIPYVKDGVNSLLKLGTLQDMKLSFAGSSDKVYGGDSMSPIAIIMKDTSQTVSFTEAKFGLDYLKVAVGADINDGGECIFNVEPTLIATGTSFTVPGSLTNIIPEETIVCLSDDAEGIENVTPLSYSAATTPAAGSFGITAAGVITLGASVTNKYISVNGLYTDSTAQSAVMTNASLPSYVTIRHTSLPFERSDGKKIVLHTIIYRALATGKLDIDQKRQTASAPVLEFEVFDAGRSDGVVIFITKQVVG